MCDSYQYLLLQGGKLGQLVPLFLLPSHIRCDAEYVLHTSTELSSGGLPCAAATIAQLDKEKKLREGHTIQPNTHTTQPSTQINASTVVVSGIPAQQPVAVATAVPSPQGGAIATTISASQTGMMVGEVMTTGQPSVASPTIIMTGPDGKTYMVPVQVRYESRIIPRRVPFVCL